MNRACPDFPRGAPVVEACVVKNEGTAFLSLLRTCAKNKDLYRGIRAHDDIIRKGLLQNCSDALVAMYAKCGELAKAKELFDVHKSRNAFIWTALIAGCTQKGLSQDALNYYEHMQDTGLSPNAVTYCCILKACGCIKAAKKGEQIHKEISKQRLLQDNLVLGNALISMYAKCGALTKARRVLEDLPVRNVVSWNTLIVGYAEHGKGEQAFTCLQGMQHEGLTPNTVTFICLLKACASMRSADKGKRIHDEIAKQGLLQNNLVLGNALLNMYAKCGALIKAQEVFRELPVKKIISWNALIAGFVDHHEGEQAITCFEKMKQEGLSPDTVTYICTLKACGSIKAANKGVSLHDEIAEQGLLENDVMLGNALISMYAKCGALAKARAALEDLPDRNVVSWNALIAGYTEQGKGEEALDCYDRMRSEGLSPNAVTYTYMLQACGCIGAADRGEDFHDDISREGFLGSNLMLGTALVDMYVKCDALAKAQRVLEELSERDAIAWNALIGGYVQHGKVEEAVKCLEQMGREGLCPEVVTFICILKACGSLGAAEKGEKVHNEIAKQGLLGNDIVLGSALIDMYAKCGVMTKARQVLKELPARNAICWTALIAGYAERGEGEEALTCLEQMQREGLSPNATTFVCVLKACGSIGAADKGERIHDEIAKQGMLGNDIVLGTALVDMYAKCGALAKARRVLKELPLWNDVSWTALIAGYAEHGDGEQALQCFQEMQNEGLSPNATTFLCVLSVCSRFSLVEDAQVHFMAMSTKYGIKPVVEHYTCMVDLFGRTGQLDKAVAVIEKTPSSDIAVWAAVLSACQKWGDVDVARWAYHRAVQLDKSGAAAYLLMANVYAAAGMQKVAEGIQTMEVESSSMEKSMQR